MLSIAILELSLSKFTVNLLLELIRLKYVCIDDLIILASAYIAVPAIAGAATAPTGLADRRLPTPEAKPLTVFINCTANGLSYKLIAAFCNEIFALSIEFPTVSSLINASRNTEPAALLAVSFKFSASLFKAEKRASTREAFLTSINSCIAATFC